MTRRPFQPSRSFCARPCFICALLGLVLLPGVAAGQRPLRESPAPVKAEWNWGEISAGRIYSSYAVAPGYCDVERPVTVVVEDIGPLYVPSSFFVPPEGRLIPIFVSALDPEGEIPVSGSDIDGTIEFRYGREGACAPLAVRYRVIGRIVRETHDDTDGSP